MNIVLTGFMGTGKTSVGKRVAERLSMTFLDMDGVIEERQERKISDIFANEGEPFFRDIERALVVELAQCSGLVIATGGGVVLNKANTRDFEESGLVFCLNARPETILARVEKEGHRPLLEDGEKMRNIMRILESRRKIYGAIALQVDTTSLSIEEVADRVIGIYRSQPPIPAQHPVTS